MLTDKQQRAANQGNRMIEYLKAVTLPIAPITLKDGTKIYNTSKYVNGHVYSLREYPILSRYWLVSYYRLYELRKYILATQVLST